MVRDAPQTPFRLLAGGKSGAAGPEWDGDHLHQQQREAALLGHRQEGGAHGLPPASAAARLAPPARPEAAGAAAGRPGARPGHRRQPHGRHQEAREKHFAEVTVSPLGTLPCVSPVTFLFIITYRRVHGTCTENEKIKIGFKFFNRMSNLYSDVVFPFLLNAHNLNSIRKRIANSNKISSLRTKLFLNKRPSAPLSGQRAQQGEGLGAAAPLLRVPTACPHRATRPHARGAWTVAE